MKFFPLSPNSPAARTRAARRFPARNIRVRAAKGSVDAIRRFRRVSRVRRLMEFTLACLLIGTPWLLFVTS